MHHGRIGPFACLLAPPAVCHLTRGAQLRCATPKRPRPASESPDDFQKASNATAARFKLMLAAFGFLVT